MSLLLFLLLLIIYYYSLFNIIIISGLFSSVFVVVCLFRFNNNTNKNGNLNVIIKVRLLSTIIDFYERLSGGAVGRTHIRKFTGGLTLSRQRCGLPERR